MSIRSEVKCVTRKGDTSLVEEEEDSKGKDGGGLGKGHVKNVPRSPTGGQARSPKKKKQVNEGKGSRKQKKGW